MTATRALTQRHRGQQLLLRRSTQAAVAQIWPALDYARLDATFPAFTLAAARLVERNRATSAGITAGYIRQFRREAGIPGNAPLVKPRHLKAEKLGAVLRVTSLASIKSATAGGTAADVAMQNALTLAQGALVRLTLDGGRDMFTDSLAADSAAVGWQRVLGGGGCDFCQMLAGRGAVYKGDTVDFASHDHCGCSAEPQYGDGLKTVRAYVPSTRNIRDVDRERVRAYLRDHPNA